jgi:spermidine synthase
MYLANVRCPLEGRKSRVLDEVQEAFGAEFENVCVIAENASEPKSLGNNVLVATNRSFS